VESVITWTGQAACTLQAALRMTNEAFAAHLGIGIRTVASWHQRPEMLPKAVMQQILDEALQRASIDQKRRFAQLVGTEAADERTLADAERKVSADPNIEALVEWVDKHARWTPGTARRKVVERLAAVDVETLNERRQRHSLATQEQVAAGLSSYYGIRPGYGTYKGHCGSRSFGTTIVSRPDWLDLKTTLTPEVDRLRLVSNDANDRSWTLDEFATDNAVNRLAEAIAIETRIYDLPLYRLMSIDVGSGSLDGTLGLASFAEYALTLDLLENEIVDAVATGTGTNPGHLPLRDRYLPDIDSVIDVSDRLCAGGALALFAVARPASAYNQPDYLILVQERSSHVVNSARRLSLTQGFHQPMIDYRLETRISLTLMRELEEEMFGREELDNTVTNHRGADPMHPTRLTRPMRWLTKAPDRMRIEATGFGLDLVNGNYEFANLILVEDERFWDRFGGYVEANWEAGSIRRYSSQDRELITELISDPAWTNEGLFTLLQGIRRLAQIAPERVDLPHIDWTLD
jgi:hypothetical protein